MENIVITYWYWWVAALVCLILEMFVPGVVFIWMSAAAGITGAVLYFVPGMSWEWQFTLFSVLTIASVITWRYFIHPKDTETDQPKLNRRGSQYIGRRFTLESAIVNGVGTIRVDDTTWRVRGSDVASGTTVTIVDVDGMELVAEADSD